MKNSSRLSDLIGYKIRVITQIGRVYIGELMSFDKHMNLILGDCVEERIPKTQIEKLRDAKDTGAVKSEKRILGLTILRGEHVLTTMIEDKPTMTKKERLSGIKKQEKQVQKQKGQRKVKNQKVDSRSNGRVSKPSNNVRINEEVTRRKFQPPPGFKRR